MKTNNIEDTAVELELTDEEEHFIRVLTDAYTGQAWLNSTPEIVATIKDKLDANEQLDQTECAFLSSLIAFKGVIEFPSQSYDENKVGESIRDKIDTAIVSTVEE